MKGYSETSVTEIGHQRFFYKGLGSLLGKKVNFVPLGSDTREQVLGGLGGGKSRAEAPWWGSDRGSHTELTVRGKGDPVNAGHRCVLLFSQSLNPKTKSL